VPVNLSVRTEQQKLEATYHAEALQSPGTGQRTEALDLCSPEARNCKTERGGEIYWTLADLDGQCITNQAGSCDGNDTRAIAPKCKSLEWHVELFRKRHECRGQQRADGYDRLALDLTERCLLRTPYASAAIADDHREKSFLPSGPVVGVIG